MSDPRDESLAQLKTRIEEVKRYHAPAPSEPRPASAYHVATELAAGVLVGGLCGYHLDKVLATGPLFFIVCLLFGFVAGFYNVYRQATREDSTDNQKH